MRSATATGLCVAHLSFVRAREATRPAQFFPLTVSDYLLGLSDLTGELMRFAISNIARRGGRPRASQVCAFVRGCKSGGPYIVSLLEKLVFTCPDFERFTPHVRELSKKQSVTANSLEKIEAGMYNPHSWCE